MTFSQFQCGWMAPDAVINGVITPVDGRKEMGAWGYFALLIEVIDILF